MQISSNRPRLVISQPATTALGSRVAGSGARCTEVMCRCISCSGVRRQVIERDEEHLLARPRSQYPDAQRHQWIREARAGSSEALGHLIAACYPYLMAIASRELSASLRSKLDPADLVQDTALDAHRNFGQFQGERFGQLLAWLRRIILNNAATARRSYAQTAKRQLDRERSQGQISADRLVGTLPPPHERLEFFEEQVELERCLVALPPDMRMVILLRHRDHLSFPQVGAEMGRTSEAARKLLARAIRRLRFAVRGNR